MLSINLDAAVRLHDRAQFFGWTQGLLQGLINHEVLICALRNPETGALFFDCFSAVVPDPPIFGELLMHDSLALRIAGAWEARRYRPLALEVREAPLAGSALAGQIEMLGADRLVVHGTHDASGRTASLFLFGCRRQRELPRQAYYVQIMAPYLHVGWLRSQVRETAEEGDDAQGPTTALTPREREIMQWISRGKSNYEIGVILEISPLTVKNHVQKILRRLNVANRAQAVARVLELQLLRS